jgi:hypothetical protein
VNFLGGYLKLLQNIRGSLTDQILRGKQPVVDASTAPMVNRVVAPGYVKPTIDGSF